MRRKWFSYVMALLVIAWIGATVWLFMLDVP
jgi:hypothetical protein